MKGNFLYIVRKVIYYSESYKILVTSYYSYELLYGMSNEFRVKEKLRATVNCTSYDAGS